MEKKNNKNFLVVVLIIIILVLSLFIIYDKTLSDNNSDNVEQDVNNKLEVDKEEQNALETEKDNNAYEKLYVNSGIVQSLYSSIKSGDGYCGEFFEPKEEIILSNQLSSSIKWLVGYFALLDIDKNNLECNKYKPNVYFSESELSEAVACGKNYYDSESNSFVGTSMEYTELIKEETIKTKIEQIFGLNTYQRIEMIEYDSYWYKYLNQENGYVKLEVPMGGTCIGYERSLVSAIKTNSEIAINESVTYGYDNSNYNYKYTFKLHDDGSYYFYSLEKTKN